MKTAPGEYAPGAANCALAAWVAKHNHNGRPTIAQRGSYLALREQGNNDPALHIDDWAIPLPYNEDSYVDTRGAALQAWVLAEQLQVRRLCVVAHPWQSGRAERVFHRLPFAEIIVPSLDRSHVQFVPNSLHPQTRSRLRYLLFEVLIARPISAVLGWT
ncbi:MAG: hypothetical protein GY953_28265 [bacterium]|nr:hypothetical protein [bacterium]